MAFTGNYTCNRFKYFLSVGGGPTIASTFKIALYTNEATLNADTTVYTTVGEVSAPGYTAGGLVLTPSVSSIDQVDATGVAYINFSDVSWSGAITARGALIYYGIDLPAFNTVPVCVLDFGSDKTSTTTFTVDFPTASSTDALIRLS